MIEKTNAYRVGDKTFGTLEEAQAHELVQVIAPIVQETVMQRKAAEALIADKANVINILTMGPRAKPRARKANGATRKPRATQPTQVAA